MTNSLLTEAVCHSKGFYEDLWFNIIHLILKPLWRKWLPHRESN